MRTHLLRLSGPVLGLVVYALLRYLGHAPAAMAGVVTWMAVWWISEAVPLAVTSLLPLVLFPLLGIDTMGGTATNYGKEIIFLFLGGFLLALALERAQLHRRIALRIIGRIGGTGPRLIAGMMVTSALLSMWMNSTSCVLVMLPIALSLLDGDGDPALRKRLTVPLLLAVSYGATIGGMATPVGTPPNLVLLEVWRDRWPDRPPIGFGQWMSFGIPLMVIYLGIAWLLITRWVFKVPKDHISPPAEVKARLASLGKVTYAERVAAIVFATVAVLWVTGDDLTFGNGFALHGWRGRTGLTSFSDGAIAILGALMLFLIPIPQALDGDAESRPPHALLTWKYAEANVPWGILLLFGGGFAIASGIDRSGLAMEMVAGMERLKGLSPPLLIGAVSGVVCFLSELGSNTATASLTLPILAQSTEAWGLDPQALAHPGHLGSHIGFRATRWRRPCRPLYSAAGAFPCGKWSGPGIWLDLIGILVLLVAVFGL
jgi:sodium-dependent dicarboxylate transporter 2/3/5